MKIVYFAEPIPLILCTGEKTATFRVTDRKNISKGDGLSLQLLDETEFAKVTCTRTKQTRFKDLLEIIQTTQRLKDFRVIKDETPQVYKLMKEYCDEYCNNGTKIYSARVIPFKGAWMEFATDINHVMYAYIDRKKKFPVTTLLRAIGFDSDKEILDLFNLAEQIKANKSQLKKSIGRKLAARVLRKWQEDFVDEDTGELVTIERNEIILERDVILDDRR